jgi:NAD(P)-dependent dehydrogenase (short-subunit alcohol dehydrogenase family)
MNLQQLMQWYDFTGKTAVITGGTGVLGGEIACALVGCGANVAVLDRNPNLPDVLKTPLDAGPGKYMVAYADVLSRDVLSEAAQAILQAYGRIDILINAAGGNHPQATTRPDNAFFDLPKEALDFVFDLNIMGTILPSQVFGRLMADQGDGVILNVSSMNAFTPLTRIPPIRRPKPASATSPNGWRSTWRRNIRRASASTPSPPASSSPTRTASCSPTNKPAL